jgi:hypothetical protein
MYLAVKFKFRQFLTRFSISIFVKYLLTKIGLMGVIADGCLDTKFDQIDSFHT